MGRSGRPSTRPQRPFGHSAAVEVVRYPAAAAVAVDEAVNLSRRPHDSHTDHDHARPAAAIIIFEVVTRGEVQHVASPRTVLRDDVQRRTTGTIAFAIGRRAGVGRGESGTGVDPQALRGGPSDGCGRGLRRGDAYPRRGGRWRCA